MGELIVHVKGCITILLNSFLFEHMCFQMEVDADTSCQKHYHFPELKAIFILG